MKSMTSLDALPLPTIISCSSDLTASGVLRVRVYLRDGKVSSVTADMGPASLKAEEIPVVSNQPTVVNRAVTIGGREWNITCVSVGNPHCVVFMDGIDGLDVGAVGPQFEYASLFPERVNTEFVRVVNRTCLRMRVWERGNGETLACGTGACAAVAAAIENGYCASDTDVLVKVKGGDLTVRCSAENNITLTGEAVLGYEGEFEY